MTATTGTRITVLACALAGVLGCSSPSEPMEELPVLMHIAAGEAPAEMPTGLNALCFSGPDAPTVAACPVVRWKGITYWAHNYQDNRASFAVVGYDASGGYVGGIERPGARYVWNITIDEGARTITIFGQANHSVTVDWSDLPDASGLPDVS